MKITDTKSTTGVDKKRKSGKSGKSGGVSFDSMLEAAGKSGQVDKADTVDATSAPSAVGGVNPDARGKSPAIPEDASGRGHYMLDQLAELERDILVGNATAAVERLKTALATEAVDYDDLPPRLKAVVDEIDLRASVEVAKMEESKEG